MSGIRSAPLLKLTGDRKDFACDFIAIEFDDREPGCALEVTMALI
jgi:hypothetical protein